MDDCNFSVYVAKKIIRKRKEEETPRERKGKKWGMRWTGFVICAVLVSKCRNDGVCQGVILLLVSSLLFFLFGNKKDTACHYHQSIITLDREMT